MSKDPHFLRQRFAACTLLFCSCFFSCNKVANVLQNLLSFDISNTFSFAVPPASPVGQSITAIVPIGVTNDDLVRHQTTTSLVKTVKLSALKFTPDDASFPMTNFDTLKISVTKDGGASELMLGSYIGKTDSYNLSNTDFVSYFKDSKTQFKTTVRLNAAPSKTINIRTDYTFTFTADPL